MNAIRPEPYIYSVENHPVADASTADPVTTEVVRAALNSAANQMKKTLIRTAFSPIIYENHDFAVALYDRNVRMLSQAPTLPAFMGTMSFCVEAAVAAVGGAGNLNPGDMIIYNSPYGTGSHAQDCAIVAPVFRDKELIGYACNKAHWLDIGAKSTYCTDTTDVYQEGVVIPGIKILKGGEKNEEAWKFILANCRMPNEIEGDLNAQIACNNVGARELQRLIERFGQNSFDACVERMYDHAETIARQTLEKIPDGIYTASAQIDDNGLDDKTIPFEFTIEVSGSDVLVDLSGVPDASAGPINCPFPSTVSMVRITLSSIVGAGETPNDGHFRPIRIKTRPGSMFHPLAPSPCYLYGWGIMPGMEAIFKGLSTACPDLVPACGAGDICSAMFWGYRDEDGMPFMAGASLPSGQGGHVKADGATLYVPSLSFSHLVTAELMEVKFPVRFHKWEYRTDSAGAGQHRGGLGWSYHWEALNKGLLISTVEQTKSPSVGHSGGLNGEPNRLDLRFSDGTVKTIGKVTDMPLEKGTLICAEVGGGAGYGSPEKRAPEAVHNDLREGLISEEAARRHYPHAFSL